MARTLLPFLFLLLYSKPSDQITKEGAETEAEAMHGGPCALRAGVGAGAGSWHLGDLSSLMAKVPGPAPPLQFHQ